MSHWRLAHNPALFLCFTWGLKESAASNANSKAVSVYQSGASGSQFPNKLVAKVVWN
jgi:hypothetical protein